MWPAAAAAAASAVVAAARATASAPVCGGGGGGAGGTLQRAGNGKASRSIEEIKLVFERNKGAIYAIYNRALREEPACRARWCWS